MERLLGHIVQLKEMLQKSVSEHDTVCSNFYALLYRNASAISTR